MIMLGRKQYHNQFGGIWTRVFVTIVLLYLVLPITIIFPLSLSPSTYLQFPPRAISLRWYYNYINSPDWLNATKNSVIIAGLASTLSTVMGCMAAVGLSKRMFRGRDMARRAMILPMTVPEIIVAVSIYYLYALLGYVGIRLIDSVIGLALAHSLLALPMSFLMISASLSVVDSSLEGASRTLGAGPLRTFRKIILPLIRPGMIGSALLAVLTSLNDLLIALFVSGVSAKTLTKKMWDAMRVETDPTVAAVSSTFVFITVLIIILSNVAGREGKSVIGR